jgi:nitroreductase
MYNNETLQIIKQRRSVRDYNNKQISDDEINVILEAGIYAPNGSGQIEDYIHFAVIQNKNLLNKINNYAKTFARQSEIEWLKKYGNDPNFNCLYNSHTLIIVSYNENWVQPEIDCAAATQNMLIAAESIGLGSCWLYFPLQAFYSEYGKELMEELKIPNGFKPITSIVVGYKVNEKINIPKKIVKNISYIK